MKQRKKHHHDVFDNYVSRLFKNWVFVFPMPKNGRALLLDKIAHTQNNPFLWVDFSLTVIRWTFRNLILEPIDIAFQPVLYFSDADLYPTYVTDKILHQSFIG